MTAIDADAAAGRSARRRRRPACPTPGIAIGRDGVRLAYDVYGAGEPTIVLLPSAPIVHSRQWKGADPLPEPARTGSSTYDGRGNGRSDRPTDPDGLRRRPDRRRHRGRHGRDRHGAAPSSSACAATASGGRSASRPTQPERVARDRRLRRRRPAPVPAPSAGTRRLDVRATSCRPTRAGPGSTGTTGGATTPASPASSSRRSPPSRTRPRRSRTPSAGRSTAPVDAMLAEHRGRLPLDREAVEAIVPRRPLPDAPRPRHRGPAASRSSAPSGSPS